MDAPPTRAAAIEALTAPGQPYELERVTIGGTPLKAFKNAPRSLRELYADTDSDQTFFV